MSKELELFPTSSNAMGSPTANTEVLPQNTAVKTMTVKEVAEALEVSDKTILNHIKKLFPGYVKEGVLTIITEEMFSDIKNSLIKNAHLKSERAFTVISDIDLEEMTLKVVEHLKSKVEYLKNKIAEDAPKVDAYNELMLAENEMSIKEVAAIINVPNMGQNNLFLFLKNEKILQSDNVPYRQYIDKGYFRQIPQTYTNKNGTVLERNKTVCTTKGLDFIRRLIKSRRV